MFANFETMEKKMSMRVRFTVDDLDFSLPLSYVMERPHSNKTVWHCRVENTDEALPEWVTREFVVIQSQKDDVGHRQVVPRDSSWGSLYGAMFADHVASELVFRERVLMNKN